MHSSEATIMTIGRRQEERRLHNRSPCLIGEPVFSTETTLLPIVFTLPFTEVCSRSITSQLITSWTQCLQAEGRGGRESVSQRGYGQTFKEQAKWKPRRSSESSIPPSGKSAAKDVQNAEATVIFNKLHHTHTSSPPSLLTCFWGVPLGHIAALFPRMLKRKDTTPRACRAACERGCWIFCTTWNEAFCDPKGRNPSPEGSSVGTYSRTCDRKECPMAVARVEGKYGRPGHHRRRSGNCTSGFPVSSVAGHIQSREGSSSAPQKPSLHWGCPL